MKKCVLFIILLMISILGYSKERYSDSVIWGSYCGECKEQCSVIRKIISSNLYIDKTDKVFQLKPFNPIRYVFNGVGEAGSEYEKYKWLLTLPVPKIIKTGEKTFGQSDAYDQCGYR